MSTIGHKEGSVERHLWWLAAFLTALAVYELVAAFSNVYPTISETVAGLPLAWVIGIAIGLVVLAVHFVRMWQRRNQRRR
jgi:uncharacterized membrane protein YedE/YeeE